MDESVGQLIGVGEDIVQLGFSVWIILKLCSVDYLIFSQVDSLRKGNKIL